jgi:hypothetical protein
MERDNDPLIYANFVQWLPNIWGNVEEVNWIGRKWINQKCGWTGGTNRRRRKGAMKRKEKREEEEKGRQGRKGGRAGDVITTRLSHFSSSLGFSFLSDSLKMSEIAAGGELFCLWSILKNPFSSCSAPFTFVRLIESTLMALTLNQAAFILN